MTVARVNRAERQRTSRHPVSHAGNVTEGNRGRQGDLLPTRAVGRAWITERPTLLTSNILEFLTKFSGGGSACRLSAPDDTPRQPTGRSASMCRATPDFARTIRLKRIGIQSSCHGVERLRPVDLVRAIHDRLSFREILNPRKAVVVPLVLQTGFVHTSGKPLSAVDADLNGKRKPGLNSSRHEAVSRIDPVVVKELAPARRLLRVRLSSIRAGRCFQSLPSAAPRGGATDPAG